MPTVMRRTKKSRKEKAYLNIQKNMKTKPNILVLVGEDTSPLHGCYGDPCARTPAIDSIAANGTRYTNTFSTAPVSAPSRSALISGRTAFSLGSHHMRSNLINPPKLFTECLRDAGYYVNWNNKMDFNFTPPDDFADDCCDWNEDLAEGRLPDQPWFLYNNFNISHESMMWEWKSKEFVGPELPESERCSPSTVSVPAYLPDTLEVRQDIARHYDSLAVQDKFVGQALEALERSGQRENTVVIYLADHGRGLAREKRFCYYAGIHVPLIVQAPGMVEAGAVSDELISLLDIAPTLLNLAGAERPPELQGKVFFGERKDPPCEYVFAGRDRMDEAFDRVRVARSLKFHYIRNDFPEIPYAVRIQFMEKQRTTQVLREKFAKGELTPAQCLWMSETKPPEELYAADDPENIHNLAGDPAYHETLVAHREALARFLAETGDMGERTERDLIDAGIITDERLVEYRDWVAPLPAAYRIGPEIAPIEMPV